ncbi:MAG: alanine--tRNA ligase, partial [Candidatus Aenigmatarchaeota archaeon]
MLTKQTLRKKFAKEWNKHYQVDIFREEGFIRKTCPRCGKNFWTLDAERKTCPDPPCENYGFIGRPVTKQKWDYIETWKRFEKFFKKEGHTSVQRYPVIDRWRPDLFFTIASIQDFQRIDQGNMVFEYPANPLVVPQVCLRFNDIPNVGVTGRHHTSFIMSGQHAFGYPKEGYFKDRCMELDFKFLHGVIGIPKEEIVYIEDVWSMPDYSAFGPSIETFSKGLELVNHVFMQFQKSDSGYKKLDILVNDTGWGHERLVWFSQGTPTGYDAVFGPVIEWMRKQTGMHKTELFDRYSVVSGEINFDEISGVDKIKKSISKRLGIDVKHLDETIKPQQALYAIADHTKTLLFALTDGGIPSNVGGGYNLRVLLRRIISFLKEYNMSLDIDKVTEKHARHLKQMFPELSEGLEVFSNVFEIERKRYENTIKKAGILVEKELKKGINEETLLRLYTSNGITPELVEKIAKAKGLDFHIPEDFYTRITEKHMKGEGPDAVEKKIDVGEAPKTKLLYYENPYHVNFEAEVVGVSGEWVALDRTCFYPEGGGQPGDRGFLVYNNKRFEVTDVQKVGSVVLHKAAGLKKGMNVKGAIDWNRRYQLMQMHTCTHIVAGVTRKIIGKHVWQAGAQKGEKSSRIDLTHYEPFTTKEISEIEKEANRAVIKGLKVDTVFMPRSQAEKKYGFVLYQGGASPGKTIRVVSIGDLDSEACAGTHVSNTKEIGIIKIIRTERIQDGVNRIEFTCGKAAKIFEESQRKLWDGVIEKISEMNMFKDMIKSVSVTDIPRELDSAARVFSVDKTQLPKTISR